MAERFGFSGVPYYVLLLIRTIVLLRQCLSVQLLQQFVPDGTAFGPFVGFVRQLGRAAQFREDLIVEEVHGVVQHVGVGAEARRVTNILLRSMQMLQGANLVGPTLLLRV